MTKITAAMVQDSHAIHSFHRIINSLLVTDIAKRDDNVVTDFISVQQLKTHSAIGNAIRERRKHMGLSKKQLAAIFAVPVDFIKLIELGYVTKMQILIDAEESVTPLVQALEDYFIEQGEREQAKAAKKVQPKKLTTETRGWPFVETK